MKEIFKSPWGSILILFMLVGVGAGLRFANLGAKTPSSIEVSSLVFSLGNSLSSIPLNQAISLDTLSQVLHPNPDANISSVIHNLMTESTHPPVYFILNHFWLKLFPTENGLVSLWAARALAALLGVASIPAIYYLAWRVFRSRLVAQVSAALMAVSPYGIFLAQEARHYTLPVLLIIASLGCFFNAIHKINQQEKLPIWLGLLWVIVNSLGIAVHYFFSLALAAEGLVLLICWLRDLPINKKLNEASEKNASLNIFSLYWLRIYAVAAGTLVGGLVWIPALNRVSDSELTKWIYQELNWLDFLEPIPRMLAWLISMVALLPVEGVSLPIIIISGLVLGIFTIWMIPLLIRGIQVLLKQPETRLTIISLIGFVLGAITIFFGIIYGLGADLTLAARYHFVYFPGLILLVGASLAQLHHKKAIAMILILGFLGGMTVVSNWGFQKSKQADVLVPQIANLQVPTVPVLIATVHKTHAETRAMIGMAWEFNRFYHSSKAVATDAKLNPPLFLLAHKEDDSDAATDTLYKTLKELPKPVDLWLVNFSGVTELEKQNCLVDSQKHPKVAGYKYKLYHCRG